MEINRGLDLKLHYKTAREKKKRRKAKEVGLKKHISLLGVSLVVVVLASG